ncbi:MAG: DUF1674 domain-containing protein [Synechococcus sp.]|nr:DUF1674 domain-containing protein [Synechococcus sp.]
MSTEKPRQDNGKTVAPLVEKPAKPLQTQKPKETGGPAGPEPTRYGDWEIGGKCVDF